MTVLIRYIPSQANQSADPANKHYTWILYYTVANGQLRRSGEEDSQHEQLRHKIAISICYYHPHKTITRSYVLLLHSRSESRTMDGIMDDGDLKSPTVTDKANVYFLHSFFSMSCLYHLCRMRVSFSVSQFPNLISQSFTG